MNDDHRSEISRADEDRSFFQSTIAPVMWQLWGFRRALLLSGLLALALSGIAGALMYLDQPIERTATVPFRLLFEGAEQGRYPSEMPFSSSDIVATPVLNEVFTRNDLARYTTYEALANRLFVLEAGRDAELLALEYRNKLADPRLTTVDRANLEKEFKERLDAIRLDYTLTLMSPSDGWQMPPVLLQKVLSDILGTWATHAAERRGALEYQKPLVTSRVPGPDETANTALVPRADALRVQLRRLARNIEELQLLPGGNVVRGGPGGVSLPELRAHVEDVTAYQVQPLFRRIIHEALVTDRATTLRYLEEQLARTTRDAEEAEGRQEAIVSSLLTYVTERTVPAGQGQTPSAAPQSGGLVPMPQISDSFIDRLMTMGSMSDDIEFRQGMVDDASRAGLEAVAAQKERNYYQSLLESVRGGAARAAAPDGPRADAAAELAQLEKSTLRIAEEAKELYATLSKSNLNPSAILYTISGPFTLQVHRPLSLRRVLVYSGVVTFATMLLVAMACLISLYVASGSAARMARKRPGPVAPESEPREMVDRQLT